MSETEFPEAAEEDGTTEWGAGVGAGVGTGAGAGAGAGAAGVAGGALCGCVASCAGSLSNGLIFPVAVRKAGGRIFLYDFFFEIFNFFVGFCSVCLRLNSFNGSVKMNFVSFHHEIDDKSAQPINHMGIKAKSKMIKAHSDGF